MYITIPAGIKSRIRIIKNKKPKNQKKKNKKKLSKSEISGLLLILAKFVTEQKM